MKYVIIFVAVFLFLCPKVHAASGVIIDYQSTRTSSSTLGIDSHCSNLITLTTTVAVYNHPIGSGSALISGVTSIFQGTVGAPGKLFTCVYKDGSAPGSSTGSFLGSGSVLVSSIPWGSGNPTDATMIMDSPFLLSAGHKYFFVIGDTSGTSTPAFIYQGVGGNNGTKPYFGSLFLGTYTDLTVRRTRLKLFGTVVAANSNSPFPWLILSLDRLYYISRLYAYTT